jgi:hypothetical protein
LSDQIVEVAREPVATPEDWPAVSVVVPTHNRPGMMASAVRAILEQQYPGFIECLVVFDREEPRPPPVEVPAGRELRLLRNVRTPGPAGGYNTGALAARGEFLAICDDDDEWLPGKLELQIEAIRRHPDATVATCGFHLLIRRTTTRIPPKELLTLDDLLLSGAASIHSSTILTRREDFLSRIGLIDEDVPGSYAEDLEWLVRAARLGPFVAVRLPLVRVSFQQSGFLQRWDLVVESGPYLLAKIPEFRRHPASLAKMYGRIAFGHAALGHAGEARRWARESIRVNRRQVQPYLALLVSYRILRAETVLRLANVVGRGV